MSCYRIAIFFLLGSISVLGGDWPQFRGPGRDNISTETGLYRIWPAGGPKVLWKTSVCEGYAGAAIRDGRLYLNDYDARKKEHLVRCISMDTGKDIWTWGYPVEIRTNHGITRTVPAIGLKFGGIDPKAKEQTAKVAREFVQRFKAQHRALNCRELLGCDMGTPEGRKVFKEKNLHDTVCMGIVRDAAKILSELLAQPQRG